MAAPRGEELILILVAVGGLALLVLAASAWLAARSRRRPPPKPAKKTFEHGRRAARQRAPASVEAALQALQTAPVGKVMQARADDRAADVVVERRKNQPCAATAGFVAGLFESAWAHDVFVTHPQCAGAKGGACHYLVQRSVSASGAQAGGASTPRSADARRRWPGARAGGP